jgi:hypothetical protein
MGAWPEREAPAERIASVVLAVEKGMDSSIPFSVALCFFLRAITQHENVVSIEPLHSQMHASFGDHIISDDHLSTML